MGAIGIDWQVLLAQFVNFAILFGLLSVLLYKPMRRMLDERSNKIKESMEQAEQIKEQMTKSEEQVKLQLDTARREGQDILAQAAQMGERLKEEAKGEARCPQGGTGYIGSSGSNGGAPQGGGKRGGKAGGGGYRRPGAH